MTGNHNILIEGFKEPKKFVKTWSKMYRYPQEGKYEKNIDTALKDKRSFIEMYKWKNGTKDKISNRKMEVIEEYWDKVSILRRLKNNFDWEAFEEGFRPNENAAIWKLFLLHLVDKSKFPIFDQHVYRFYMFNQEGVIEEIGSSNKKKFDFYKSVYQPWFNKIQKTNHLNSKRMDEAFFVYGKALKGLTGMPIIIDKNG